MVLDVSEILDRKDPRLRVFSTLRLHWDRIALCDDPDDVPLETHSLELFSAKLWDRGFSRGSNGGELDQPEMFTWGEMTPRPRWDQHPGMYTKYGDCTELFAAADDRFAILGTGDALELVFDAEALPELREGWRRDFLLYLDGWAKDRDPNTVRALEVEPLPHHGMSAYPYDEKREPFPDGPEWQAWRERWNTRPAKRWIRPLAPQAEAKWLLGE